MSQPGGDHSHEHDAPTLSGGSVPVDAPTIGVGAGQPAPVAAPILPHPSPPPSPPPGYTNPIVVGTPPPPAIGMPSAMTTGPVDPPRSRVAITAVVAAGLLAVVVAAGALVIAIGAGDDDSSDRASEEVSQGSGGVPLSTATSVVSTTSTTAAPAATTTEGPTTTTTVVPMGAPMYGSYVAMLWSSKDVGDSGEVDRMRSAKEAQYGVPTTVVYGDAYRSLRDGTVGLVYAGGFATVRDAAQWCWDRGERSATGCFGVGLNDDWSETDRNGTGRMYVNEL